MKHQQLTAVKGIASVFWKYLLVLLILYSNSTDLSAQLQKLSSIQKSDSALVKAINVYDDAIGRNSFLYTGRVYNDIYASIEGHQYFKEDYWELGEIVYDGHYFDSVYLMYDIQNDLLLLEHFNSNGMLSPITLHNPKISAFKLQGYSFVKLEKDTVSGMPAGFYNKLYVGDKLGIYVLRNKEITKSNNLNSVAEIFTERDKFYLKKDDIFYPVRKKGDILKVLQDHKKEIKGHIKRNMMLYRQDPDRTLLSVAIYYESLFE